MRKKKIFTLLCCFFSLIFLNGQKLNFKDKSFEKAIIENYNTCHNGSIDQHEAEAVLQLFLVKKGNSSDEDLPFFSNARMVVLDENSIRNLS